MIKSVIILSSLLFLCTTVKATVCSYSIFREEKINLVLCQNHGRGKVTALLMKARTKALNEYIKEKIARGELEDKKFEIEVNDPIMSSLYLALTQGKNGYYVLYSGMAFPSLQQLTAIVDYFAKPDWKPFIVEFNPTSDNETNEARYDAGYNKVNDFFKSGIGHTPYTYQPFTIWEKDGVAVEFSGDSLRYSIDDAIFPLPVTFPLPVNIQDRYLFFEDDAVFVVKDMKITKSFDIRKAPIDEDISVVAQAKWVNIIHGWSGQNDWAYSYSYETDSLYLSPRWKYLNLTADGSRGNSYNDFLWQTDNHRGVMITGYTGTSTEITIPNTINGMSVNGIGQNAFREKNLTGVIIPNSVKFIGSYAFLDNQLTNIVIPNSVVVIGSSAFMDNLLTNVVIPEGITHIEYGTFAKNRLTNVTIPNSVVVIGMSAFFDNLLQNVIISKGVREIDYMAFRKNPIVSVDIGANVVLSSCILNCDANFEKAYNEGGKPAGIYTRSNTESTTWTRK